MKENLFKIEDEKREKPFAIKFRPTSFDEYFGQKHIISDGKPLKEMIIKDKIKSVILWGPPGCGKNAIAYLASKITKKKFVELNAVYTDTAKLKNIIEMAIFEYEKFNKKTLLFLDEIHRLNRAKQDILLPHLEKGDISFIGATTYNPVFSIVPALRSRTLIFELKPLTQEDIKNILKTALKKANEYLKIQISDADKVFEYIAKRCGGDARIALNVLENALVLTENDNYIINDNFVFEALPKNIIRYDKSGDEHYGTISAYIKSMRNSDVNAALYWLAKMLNSGEDPVFIARRIAIFASEDIGMANPSALVIAESAMNLVKEIGMPEARIILAQATVYMSTSIKSNSSYIAIERAINDVENKKLEDLPEFVLKKIGNNEKYIYPHDVDGKITEQKYIQSDALYYEPSDFGFEKTIKKRLELWDMLRKKKSERP